MIPVRWFEDLGRDLADIPELQPPDGVTILAFERSDEVRLVHNEAFGDHWGSVPASAEYWAHRLDPPGTRLDLSLVAVADTEHGADQIVGYLLSGHYPQDATITGRDSGWIETLGTLRSWRKRGIASALIVAALHAYVEAGLDHAMIGVDADNPSGAARLYRALGFEKLAGGVTYELAI
jgi:ribosomal protein S18 acetylase RimI-like enzyme